MLGIHSTFILLNKEYPRTLVSRVTIPRPVIPSRSLIQTQSIRKTNDVLNKSTIQSNDRVIIKSSVHANDTIGVVKSSAPSLRIGAVRGTRPSNGLRLVTEKESKLIAKKRKLEESLVPKKKKKRIKKEKKNDRLCSESSIDIKHSENKTKCKPKSRIDIKHSESIIDIKHSESKTECKPKSRTEKKHFESKIECKTKSRIESKIIKTEPKYETEDERIALQQRSLECENEIDVDIDSKLPIQDDLTSLSNTPWWFSRGYVRVISIDPGFVRFATSAGTLRCIQDSKSPMSLTGCIDEISHLSVQSLLPDGMNTQDTNLETLLDIATPILRVFFIDLCRVFQCDECWIEQQPPINLKTNAISRVIRGMIQMLCPNVVVREVDPRHKLEWAALLPIHIRQYATKYYRNKVLVSTAMTYLFEEIITRVKRLGGYKSLSTIDQCTLKCILERKKTIHKFDMDDAEANRIAGFIKIMNIVWKNGSSGREIHFGDGKSGLRELNNTTVVRKPRQLNMASSLLPSHFDSG